MHKRSECTACLLSRVHIPGRPDKGGGALCFMVCIFRNNDQIGTKFGTNQSHFIVNIAPEFKSALENSDV